MSTKHRTTARADAPQSIVIRPDAALWERLQAARAVMAAEMGGEPSLAALTRVLLVRGMRGMVPTVAERTKPLAKARAKKGGAR